MSVLEDNLTMKFEETLQKLQVPEWKVFSVLGVLVVSSHVLDRGKSHICDYMPSLGTFSMER